MYNKSLDYKLQDYLLQKIILQPIGDNKLLYLHLVITQYKFLNYLKSPQGLLFIWKEWMNSVYKFLYNLLKTLVAFIFRESYCTNTGDNLVPKYPTTMRGEMWHLI